MPVADREERAAGVDRDEQCCAGYQLFVVQVTGVNAWWRGEELPEEAEDGLLTAEDVTGLDLLDTELVVLSACNTGLGEIRTGEGVFGLRRAFQIAGVRTVIMSLWPVEDQATRTWMRTLYEGRLRQHLTTAEAVRAAGRRVLNERRARGLGAHPFYWAAFVAAGDWR